MIKFLLCTLTNNGQPFISVSRISKCCVTAPQAQTPRPPADGQSVRQHDNIKETERQLCGLMTSPRQAGKRHGHQQEELCLSPKLSANMVFPPIGGMRRFGSHELDWILPVSGASRWTVPLFQIIRYKRSYRTCYKYF